MEDAVTIKMLMFGFVLFITACGAPFTYAGTQEGIEAPDADPPAPDAEPTTEADTAPDSGMVNPDASPQRDSGNGGQDSGQPTMCSGSTCAAGQVCVTKTTNGGQCDQTIYVTNGNACPLTMVECGDIDAGNVGCQVHTVTATCEDVPTSCHDALTCDGACGIALCGSCDCESASDTSIACGCAAP